MSAPLISVQGVRKEFPGVVALDGASLDLHAGEVIGLVGKNGAGKSTLIKVLAGVEQPDAGHVLIDGEPVSLSTPHDATARGLAFVHQEISQAQTLTVAENVLLGLGYPKRGPLVSWRQLHARTREILARLDARIDPGELVARLSPAQQRLVMIGRALAQKARLLVLDEPSAALTEDEIEQLHKVVAHLASEGVTVIYISHRLDEILAVSSRVIVMRDARVVADHATAELTHRRLVELITGGATDIVRTRAERDRPAPAADAATLLSYQSEATGGFSVSVRSGEIVGLAGLVGSGRTELVRALFGAEGGREHATIGGVATNVARPADAIRAGMVLLPEDRRSEGNIGTFSVKRNLTLVSLSRLRVARWLGIPSGRREAQAAAAAIERLDIRTASPDTPVRWLSGGNQQKVMLGKWLALDARVYIFDEPTVGIDVEAKEEAFRLIDDLARRGKGVVLISSDFSELVAMCDRVLILKEGRIVAERRGGEITEVALVGACYEAG